MFGFLLRIIKKRQPDKNIVADEEFVPKETIQPDGTITVEIYVPLLEEGTPTVRGTQAISLGGDLYKVLPAEDYDPEDEIWEFKPGSIVRCDVATDFRNGEKFLRAIEMQLPDGTFVRSNGGT